MNTLMDCVSPELALVDPELARVLRALLPEPDDCVAQRALATPTLPVAATWSRLEVLRDAALWPAALAPGYAAEPLMAASLSNTMRRLDPGDALQTHTAGRVAAGRASRHLRLVATCTVGLGLLAVPLLAFVPANESREPRLVEKRPSLKRGSETPVAPKPVKSGNETPVRPLPEASARDEPTVAPTSPRKRPRAEPKPANPPKVEAEVRSMGIRWARVRGAELYNVVFVRDGARIDRWVKENRLTFARPARGKQVQPALTHLWFVYPVYRKPAGYRFGKLIQQGSVSVSENSIGGRRQPLGS